MTIPHHNSRAGPLALLCSTALLTLLLVGSLSPALADGGNGGAGSMSDAGGAGGTLNSPQGEDGAGIGAGGGGGGGGGPGGGVGSGGQGSGSGGDGGDHGFVGGDLPTSGVTGGAGGNGGDGYDRGDFGGGGGGGGAGGYGAILDGIGMAAVAVDQTVSGGSGGYGGEHGRFSGGGSGGDGGLGIFFIGEALTNAGTIGGGAGGNGGSAITGDSGHGGDGGMGLSYSGELLTNTGTISGGAGGDSGPVRDGSAGSGGGGGAGVSFVGELLTNTGTISGGAGGDGGYGPRNLAGDGGVGISMAAGSLTNTSSIAGGSGGMVTGDDSAYGAGGVGLVGSDLHIINSGMISGGLAGDGITRANAIAFTGGSNRLELQAGSTIIGNVVAGGGNNVLALGGATDATFDVSGMGAGLQYQGFTDFEKTGTSTWTLEGNGSGFAGNSVIAAGTLLVGSDTAHTDAIFGGSFAVQAGGTLGGIGTLGAGAGSTVTIASGGTIAPGNSIGTLTVDGDITFASGSIFEAEINPALESDLIETSGAATIHGGTVHALKAGGVYTPGSRWTIIGADGGVTGTFDELTQNMPFVDLALIYDANNVYIDATRNQVAFCDVAATANQCSAGDGLETTGTGRPAYDAVAALTDEVSVRQALDGLSGEIYASAKTALIEDSRFIRNAVSDRIRSAFGDATGTDMSLAAYGPDGLRPAAAGSPGPIAWGHVFGSWGSFGGDGNAAGMDSAIGGFLAGIDGEFASNIRLGLIAGYSHSSFDTKDRASSGSSDNYHLGLYGGGQWDALRLSGGIAYAWHDIETNRSVAFPGFSDALSADYNAGTFQAFGEAGYKIDTVLASFEPFVNLAHVSLNTDGFTEKGGTAALANRSSSADATFTTLGIRTSTSFDLDGMKATAHGTLGWRHAFGDTTPLSTHAFAGGGAFTVTGVPIARDAALLQAGVDLDLTDTATLSLSYAGQFSGSVRDHGFKANFNIRF